MAEVIDLTNKRARKKQVGQRDRLESARRVFLCSGCPSRCAKCGTQLESREHDCYSGGGDFSFCDICASEWEVFDKARRGEDVERQYYHNQAWFTLWESWLTYRKALTEYRDSEDFKRLLMELDQ